MAGLTGGYRWLAAEILLLLGALASPTRAEPVVDHALAGVQLLTQKDCAIVKVNFNFLVRYDSHFPLGQGQELRIKVRAIDRAQAASLVQLRREAVRAPDSKIAPMRAV